MTKYAKNCDEHNQKNTISDHGRFRQRFRQRTIGNVFLVLESQCEKQFLIVVTKD